MSNSPKKIDASEYSLLLNLAVQQITTARNYIAGQINKAATSVYWNLGKILSERQLEEGYGSGVVKQLSVDLKNNFQAWLSPRNLWDMKRFYERYQKSDEKLRQAVAVLPWGHNLLLLNKVSSLQAIELLLLNSTENGEPSQNDLLNPLMNFLNTTFHF